MRVDTIFLSCIAEQATAIIWTNAGALSIGPIGKKIKWNFNWNLYIFILENAFENVICGMAAILSLP